MAERKIQVEITEEMFQNSGTPFSPGLTNFLCLLSLDGILAADKTTNSFWDADGTDPSHPTGLDVKFWTNPNKTGRLNLHLKKWVTDNNPANAQLVAWFQLSAPSGVIPNYIYITAGGGNTDGGDYNKASVYPSGFRAHHDYQENILNTPPEGKDGTSYGIDLTENGLANGIGLWTNSNCWEHNVDGDYSEKVDSSNYLDRASGDISLEVLFNPGGGYSGGYLGQYPNMMGLNDSSGFYWNYIIGMYSASSGVARRGKFLFANTDLSYTEWYTTDTLEDGTGKWYHYIVTFTFGTASSIKFYKNGVSKTGSYIQGDGTKSPYASNDRLRVGSMVSGGGGITGYFGLTSIFFGTHSQDWITARNRSLMEQSTYLTTNGYSAVDVTGPTIDNFSPTDATVDVAVDASPAFDLKDTGSGVNLSTLDIYVSINGGANQAVCLNGVDQTGWVVTEAAISGGYRVTINPTSNFSNNATVAWTITCDDNDTNSTTSTSWNFTIISSWLWGTLPQPRITYNSIELDFEVPIIHEKPPTGIPRLSKNIAIDGSIEVIDDGGQIEYMIYLAPVPFSSSFLTDLETFFTNWAGKGKWFEFEYDILTTTARKDGWWRLKEKDWQPDAKTGLRYPKMTFIREYQ